MCVTTEEILAVHALDTEPERENTMTHATVKTNNQENMKINVSQKVAILTPAMFSLLDTKSPN